MTMAMIIKMANRTANMMLVEMPFLTLPMTTNCSGTVVVADTSLVFLSVADFITTHVELPVSKLYNFKLVSLLKALTVGLKLIETGAVN